MCNIRNSNFKRNLLIHIPYAPRKWYDNALLKNFLRLVVSSTYDLDKTLIGFQNNIKAQARMNEIPQVLLADFIHDTVFTKNMNYSVFKCTLNFYHQGAPLRSRVLDTLIHR